MFTLVNWLHGASVVPCYFVVGDSKINNGNNNNIKTAAKANYPSQGIDFPRRSNRKDKCLASSTALMPAQFLFVPTVQCLGFDRFILPPANASDEDILRGLNYASVGAGILEETGKTLGNIVTFSNQLKNHADTVSRITMMSGGNETSALSYLSKCLYHVMHGNNDFCGNYFRPKQYSSSCRYNAELFADLLIQTYTERIEVVVPIGCAPSLQAKNPWTHTPFTERFHAPVRIYNDKLKSLVDDLNRDYTDSRFICLDDFCSFWNLVDRPSSNGLAVTNMACSGIGRNKGQVRCLPHLMPSRYRNLYVFWDPFSLTEAASLAVVKKLFDNDSWSSFTYPMSILQLAKL
ncbi:hypothetical protein CDL15_Pgr001123 [Punica granatum]|uniref:Uncharacterized protein n=1 Tax=Punica granatum TaxID=22663 RepID=A0A218WKL1_PUNGR|nr:hypothetical protein CDL15_Pgr001123 [Punica granatum]